MIKEFFTRIDDGAVLLRIKGAYKPALVYRCDEGKLYAKNGVSFIRLYRGGETSATPTYSKLDLPFAAATDVFGNPVFPGSKLDRESNQQRRADETAYVAKALAEA